MHLDELLARNGVIPEDSVFSSNGVLPQLIGILPPGGIYAHLAGINLIQGKDGSWYVLEDNLRIPSGAFYPLIGSCASHAPFPQAVPASSFFPLGSLQSKILLFLHPCLPALRREKASQ